MESVKGTRREVWEAAQEAGLSEFIGKVSAAFGKDAIADISITDEQGEIFLHQPDPQSHRVIPGVQSGKNALKEAIAATKNRKHLKGN